MMKTIYKYSKQYCKYNSREKNDFITIMPSKWQGGNICIKADEIDDLIKELKEIKILLDK